MLQAFLRPLRVLSSHLFFAARFSALGRYLSRGRTFQALMISFLAASEASSVWRRLGSQLESGRCLSRPSSILEIHFARCFRILSWFKTKNLRIKMNINSECCLSTSGIRPTTACRNSTCVLGLSVERARRVNTPWSSLSVTTC